MIALQIKQLIPKLNFNLMMNVMDEYANELRMEFQIKSKWQAHNFLCLWLNPLLSVFHLFIYTVKSFFFF